jgi:hypothetical protein
MASDDQRKHLEMIQAVITRMAGNSFSIRGWAVAIIAVLGGFVAKDADPRFVFSLWFPVLCFWGLDAFYLRQERLFRKLYQAAVDGETTAPLYSMNTQPFEAKVGSTAEVAFSPTVLWLHIPIMTFVLALSFYSLHRICVGQAEKATSTSGQGVNSGKQANPPASTVATPAAPEESPHK